MEKPLISVIIPVYNVERYLKECVDSVINQTYKNLEIILVDDGSLDNCGKICDEYAETDSRVKVIHKENGGLSSARNCGLDATNGEYFMFVDGDDWVDDDIVEFLYSAAIENDASISGSYLIRAYKDGLKDREKRIGRHIYNSAQAFEFSLSSRIGTITSVSKLYKKEIFKNIRFIIGKTNEDVYYCVDTMSIASTIVFDSTQKYYYRQRKSSIMNSFDSHILDPLDAGEYVFQKTKETHPSLIKCGKSNQCYWKILTIKRIMESDENFKSNSYYKFIKKEIKKDLIFIIADKNIILRLKIQVLLLVLFPVLFRKLFLRHKENEMLFD